MSEETQQWNDLAFEKLHDLLIDLSRTLRQILGFNHAVDYRGVTFYVSQSLVIADLAPLAFLNLSESFGAGGKQAAVKRLHDRILPLLDCQHDWIAVKGSARTMRTLEKDAQALGSTLYECRSCTAWVLGGKDTALPILGRRCAPE